MAEASKPKLPATKPKETPKLLLPTMKLGNEKLLSSKVKVTKSIETVGPKTPKKEFKITEVSSTSSDTSPYFENYSILSDGALETTAESKSESEKPDSQRCQKPAIEVQTLNFTILVTDFKLKFKLN